MIDAIHVTEPVRLDQYFEHGESGSDRFGLGSVQPRKDRICQSAVCGIVLYVENEDARIETYSAVPPEKRREVFYCQEFLSFFR